MVERALVVGLNGLPMGRQVLFREPELELAFPDLVVGVWKTNLPAIVARPLLGPAQLRIVNHLNNSGRTGLDKLAADLCLPARRLRGVLDELAAAGLIEHGRGGTVRAAPLSQSFWLKAIVAVEAKIHDWRGALDQAYRNTWFASHSYVMLPAVKLTPAVIAAAASLGIGVLSFEHDECKVACRPKRHNLPVSYGAWMVNEWSIAVGRNDVAA